MNKLLTTILLIILLASCQKSKNIAQSKVEYKSQWVDSIYNNMTLEEKVGQLFMVDTYSNKEKSHSDTIKSMIKKHHLGGVTFFQGDPVKQAIQTNEYQALSKIPLLISIDAEWGLNMRLDSTFRYPYNMTLGAIKDNKLIEKIGRQIGKHSKRIGIHINFAPVVDINTNPKNPAIGVRSYGEEKTNVAKKAVAFTKGIQSEGVLACAKHFPGHGDTSQDSHKTLPTISFTSQRIDSVELYPFKKVFNAGIAGVMVAHLNVPSLENTPNLPSSLSYKITTSLLKEKLAFKGLIFTDALNMKGAANFKNPGDIDLAAFKAGNDVLLLSEDIPKAILKIIEAYKNQSITEERLSHSVKKILAAKYDVNLNDYKPIVIKNIVKDLNTTEDIELYNRVASEAITLIKNNDNIIPIKKAKTVAIIKLGDGNNNVFLTSLQQVNKTFITSKALETNLNELEKYDLVIISYHQKNTRKIRQFTNEELLLIEKIAETNKVILDVFASQYSLANLSFNNIEGVLISYENTTESQKASAQIILGLKDAKGTLPASINTSFKTDFGIFTNHSHK